MSPTNPAISQGLASLSHLRQRLLREPAPHQPDIHDQQPAGKHDQRQQVHDVDHRAEPWHHAQGLGEGEALHPLEKRQ